MTISDCVIVIPSCRSIDPLHLEHVSERVPILVVDDGDGSLRSPGPNVRVLDKTFQRKYMGADFDLIPRNTSACRNFGFYYALRESDCSIIISIDDDVVVRPGFVEAYGILGRTLPLDTITSPRWWNTIDAFVTAPPCYARGFPFDERTPQKTVVASTSARVVCHMGLWDRVLDTHAIDKQLFQEYQHEYNDLTVGQQALRVGGPHASVRFPLSSMNFGFVRELAPAMYQFPMRDQFVDRYMLSRHEDIWAGYVAQALIERRGDAVSVGAPIVRHEKVGQPLRELNGEHYGVLISPYLYRVVDAVIDDVEPAAYDVMYADLVERIATNGERLRREFAIPPLFWSFIADLMASLSRWTRLCAHALRQSGTAADTKDIEAKTRLAVRPTAES